MHPRPASSDDAVTNGCASRPLGADADERPAAGPACGDEGERLRDRLEIERPRDSGLQQTFPPHSEDLRLRLPHAAGKAVAILAELQARDRDVLQEQVVDLDRWDLA